MNLRPPDRDTMVAFWEPRIGRSAAGLAWRSKWVSTFVPIVVLVNFITVFTAVRLHSRFVWAFTWVIGSASIFLRRRRSF